MKQLLIIAIAIAVPVRAQLTLDAVTEEQRGALQAYGACLYGLARETDDGVIAPLALARKVAPQCRFQLGTAASIFSRGKPRAERDALYAKWLAREDEQGVRTVMTMRADRRASKADPASPRQGVPPPRKPAGAKPVATKPPAPKAKAAAMPATGPDGKPISAWRRAYIARHGHQPPAPRP